jgi:hypothetical protein
MMRVEVKPELLRWARERAGFDVGAQACAFWWKEPVIRDT